MIAGFPDGAWMRPLHSPRPCCSGLPWTVKITPLIMGYIYGTLLSDNPCAKCFAKYYLVNCSITS